MKKIIKTPLAAAMGVAFISTFAVTAAHAEASPFGMTELSQGYMQVAEADKAAEMACGANMKMDGSKAKLPEGACAGKKPADAKHVMGEKPAADAKATAEGKCGNMMEGDKMKKGMEGACGEMMKGKEGACGAMGAGESMKGKEGACGAGMKMPEGKCGDQCGEAMKKCADAKAKEGSCGAAMKGCGEGMQGCGEMMKGKEGACAANKADAAKTPAAPAAK
ncbi:MAG: hypothetical protein LUQ18_05320 [Methylococcaceae bacterium]|nr:hypothetical protein [Methylococcaceae bacterium]